MNEYCFSQSSIVFCNNIDTRCTVSRQRPPKLMSSLNLHGHIRVNNKYDCAILSHSLSLSVQPIIFSPFNFFFVQLKNQHKCRKMSASAHTDTCTVTVDTACPILYTQYTHTAHTYKRAKHSNSNSTNGNILSLWHRFKQK